MTKAERIAKHDAGGKKGPAPEWHWRSPIGDTGRVRAWTKSEARNRVKRQLCDGLNEDRGAGLSVVNPNKERLSEGFVFVRVGSPEWKALSRRRA
jgi:hypothetical protein